MWYGTWCFDRVIEELVDQGIDARAVELTHSGDLGQDVAAVKEALADMPGPTVLLGHSYGGIVITETAAGHDQISHLIYVCAFMPDEGETLVDLLTSVDDQPLAPGRGLILADGTSRVDPAQAADIFFGDCPKAVAKASVRRLHAEALGGPPRPPGAIAWHNKPSTYAVCARDRALSQKLQRRFATRATNTVTWPTGHSPFISRPELVVGLLRPITQQAPARVQ